MLQDVYLNELTDFIEYNKISDIIKKIDSIQKYGMVFIKLWYDNSEIDSKKINKFKNDYKDVLSKGYITIVDKHLRNEFVWYEIANRNFIDASIDYKFCSVYNKASDIILCLNELETFIKFSSSK